MFNECLLCHMTRSLDRLDSTSMVLPFLPLGVKMSQVIAVTKTNVNGVIKEGKKQSGMMSE